MCWPLSHELQARSSVGDGFNVFVTGQPLERLPNGALASRISLYAVG